MSDDVHRSTKVHNKVLKPGARRRRKHRNEHQAHGVHGVHSVHGISMFGSGSAATMHRVQTQNEACKACGGGV